MFLSEFGETFAPVRSEKIIIVRCNAYDLLRTNVIENVFRVLSNLTYHLSVFSCWMFNQLANAKFCFEKQEMNEERKVNN